MSRRKLHGAVLVAVTALIATPLTIQTVQAAPSADPPPGPIDRVLSKTDGAKSKLSPKLQARVDKGDTAKIAVFATVVGDGAAARALLDGDRVAKSGDTGLVVGTIPVQALPKLASAKGVVAVQPVELKRTGSPMGDPDPGLHRIPTLAERKAAVAKVRADEVPYPQAPPLKGSNFEKMRKLNVLDAKTHNFTGAWNEGITGTGVTVGVLDGGTDFGHPDLIGTWQTWTGQTGARAGWNGWPKAFDPFGTLQWLSAPAQVDAGLSWYTTTEAKTCGAGTTCTVSFGTKTGPSRNFGAPAGVNVHDYTFPKAWSKSGSVKLSSHPDDYLLQAYGERPAVLVTDPNTAGVYDTVYVDLDDDHSFADEKPVSKSSPASYRDMNGDGYTDLSGGLLYYISDGATAIPGGLDAFGALDTSFGPGELLAWTGDFDPGIEGHGTLTASNVVGQGVINGKAPQFKDLPGGTYPGAVLGGAPHAKLAPFGDIYFSHEFSTEFGYFLSTRRGVDVTSNSYGSSDTDNDGWDARSQEADVIHDGGRTTPLFSTGNGAPGFGTTSPPSPVAAISVGASTQFGGSGWDSITRTKQIRDNDVIEWSNRGFGANATNGVDVVADGAYSPGDATLNTVLDGRNAWTTWGGTSRSTPVAAGATALVYQAYKKAHGGAVPAGFYTDAKEILQSSAKDLEYESTIQGSGSLDAGKAVRVATDQRAKVSPANWRVGDYRGTEYPVFANVISPGGTDEQQFAIEGAGNWDISSRQLVRTDSDSMTFSSADLSKESTSNFNAPDYLLDLTNKVKQHKDADLMVVRANFPRDQFDKDNNLSADQAWRLLTYDWTDVNGDGKLWTDKDHDGVVDHTDKTTSSNIDGFLDLDFAKSEIEKGEYGRFMYHRPGANTLMSFVGNPYQRMTDGLFLGFQHSARTATIPKTDFKIQIDWYKNTDWKWITTPKRAKNSFSASIKVPSNTPYGMYSGAVVLSRGSDRMVVPVSVAVAAKANQDASGKLTGAIEFGGSDVANAQKNLLYNNGSVFGANDWTWRPESGDWRFFFLDVPKTPAVGTQFLASTTWQGTSPQTDIDTLIMGRTENHFQILPDSVFGAPYTIDTVGKSPNTNVGAGVWRFNTATGGPADLVTAPAQEGLHEVALHQVGWQGDAFNTPFKVQLGSASVAPSAVDQTTTSDSGSFDVSFEASVPLEGLKAEAFGLSQPAVTTENAQQDNPDDPSTASVKKNITLTHAAKLTVSTARDTDDLDLFVVRDANNDGNFTPDEIVGSSTTSSANESVQLIGPPDGNYQIWVHGFSVAGAAPFTLTVDPIQGNDLTVSGLPAGALPAGTPVNLHVDFNKAMTPGQTYQGELLLGPPSAPTALAVPIKITRN